LDVNERVFILTWNPGSRIAKSRRRSDRLQPGTYSIKEYYMPPLSSFPNNRLSFSGVVPSLALTAKLGPPRSEICGGALMAWAERLWVATYVSHKSRSGITCCAKAGGFVPNKWQWICALSSRK